VPKLSTSSFYANDNSTRKNTLQRWRLRCASLNTRKSYRRKKSTAWLSLPVCSMGAGVTARRPSWSSKDSTQWLLSSESNMKTSHSSCLDGTRLRILISRNSSALNQAVRRSSQNTKPRAVTVAVISLLVLHLVRVFLRRSTTHARLASTRHLNQRFVPLNFATVLFATEKLTPNTSKRTRQGSTILSLSAELARLASLAACERPPSPIWLLPRLKTLYHYWASLQITL